MQISNAHLFCSSSTSKSLDVPTTCTSNRPAGIFTYHQTASKMQGYLAEVITEMALVRIHNSPYIGIMVDESLDITTTKKLVTFCKIINNGEIKLEFCANVDIIDGKAETVYTAIVNWLTSVGIGMEKVSGFEAMEQL